jgi:hypothetical protein
VNEKDKEAAEWHSAASFQQPRFLPTPAMREVGSWPILLQKSAAMDLAAGPFVEPRSEALALTHFTQLRRDATLRDAQSLSRWRSCDQRCKPPQILGDGG